MQKIRKNDEVIVISGKDKNRRGVVLSVLKEQHMLIVEGVNTVKKHVRANPNTGERGGIVLKTLPIHQSNVMLLNSAKDKGGRVGIRILKDGKKVRYFKGTDQVIDA